MHNTRTTGFSTYAKSAQRCAAQRHTQKKQTLVLCFNLQSIESPHTIPLPHALALSDGLALPEKVELFGSSGDA